ncbi:MAG TPA: PDZ domain-containing protein [Gemmatimonadaceae bacterium]|nr:PDZ domain-containing protein [Gemmatimonadaceae bacterium]
MLIRRSACFASLLAALAAVAGAQNPIRHPADAVEARFARAQPVVHYAIRVDSANLSAFAVEMNIRNAADTFRLAMSAHPEYDDKYWRYLEDLRIEGRGGAATISRIDSSLWRVRAPGGEATVRYRIHLPTPDESPRAAWRPFLSPSGGLIGGPHSFMYIVGSTLAPAHVAVTLPNSWQIATGLTPTSDPRTFFAPTFDNLVEGPIFAGHFMSWRFFVDAVPHRVVYWPAPNATPFDTTRFVDGVRRMTEQAVAVFGRPPWREYTFIFQDNAWGGLEHANSVTLGVSSAALARDPLASLPEAAHEFFHAWNLMRIRPAEYRTVDYRVQPPTSSLWFSEGLTIFYADLMRRRAGLPTSDSTRTQHLTNIIARYLSMPGLARYSAERVSQVAYNAEAGALGDYGASTHLHGEVIGAMLDFIVRDATDGRRTLDDVMRLMLERFGGTHGFVGRDVERVIEDVCACDVTPFFDAHVRSGSAIPFDRYLALIGLRPRVEWIPAVSQSTSEPIVDLRLYAADVPPGQLARLVLTHPESPWARAGLHTGDRIVSVNGAPARTWLEFRGILQRIRIGDTTRMEVERAGKRLTVNVVAVQQTRPLVRLEEIAGASPKATRLREAWALGR